MRQTCFRSFSGLWLNLQNPSEDPDRRESHSHSGGVSAHAILVKVDLEPLPFFIITMIKIICINCETLTTNAFKLTEAERVVNVIWYMLCWSQRSERFFREVCLGWPHSFQRPTRHPSWADRDSQEPSLLSPWSVPSPVSLQLQHNYSSTNHPAQSRHTDAAIVNIYQITLIEE